MTTKLAVIPGDGIGPEVVAEGLKVLAAVLPDIETTEFKLGAARWHATGEVLPDAELASLAEHDVILLGAVGDPSVPAGVLERGLLLKLRFAFDHFVNLRPSQLYPGVATPLADIKPGDIDMVVVREGTEGLYCGAGGVLRKGTAAEVATEESLNTRHGVERVIRDAFARAAQRSRRRLTLVHKNNVLVHAGDLWARTFDEVAAEFPGVATEYLHVDAAAMFLVTQPQRFDVVVTDNLFGDILTDIAAAVSGGIGLAASVNINPTGAFPSMFEPVHGSAPDIAGTGTADPTATILSVGLLLSHLGRPDAAHRIEAAVAAELGARTPGEQIRT
ncbi:MAG: 3-isopropylmalate dehydrogenase, partial [Mycobacteriales bacterium]